MKIWTNPGILPLHWAPMITRSARPVVALWALVALLMPLASAGGVASPAAAGHGCACSTKCGDGCSCALGSHEQSATAGHGHRASWIAGHAPAGPHWESAGAVVAERCGGCQGVASSASSARSSSTAAFGGAPAFEIPSSLHPPADGAVLRSAAFGSTFAPRGPPAPSARPLKTAP